MELIFMEKLLFPTSKFTEDEAALAVTEPEIPVMEIAAVVPLGILGVKATVVTVFGTEEL
jgi:hypothetical protein